MKEIKLLITNRLINLKMMKANKLIVDLFKEDLIMLEVICQILFKKYILMGIALLDH